MFQIDSPDDHAALRTLALRMLREALAALDATDSAVAADGVRYAIAAVLDASGPGG